MKTRGLSERVRFGPVEVLPGPDGGRYPYSHTLYVHGPEPAVIDPGMTFDPARYDFDPESVAWVLNSHCHEDHEGGNHLFPNAKVIAPAEDAPFIRSLDAYAAANGMAGRAEEEAWRKMMTDVWGFRESPVHREVVDNEVVEVGGLRMRFVYLPGHTPGHAGVYFEGEDVFFIADVDLTSFGPFYGDHFSSIDQFLESIRRVRDMKPRTLVTSHGKGLFKGDEMRSALDRFEQKILQRDEAILRMLADRPHTLDEIVDAHLVYRRYPEPAFMYREIERVMIEKHLKRLERLGCTCADGALWKAAG
ncbi:MAG: MBL fold metallo-hydrolase [Deltaproteobacteria bacterium]|nr:MBL fold metallo-hydrolase [Deltaproteobacteria bacterium]